MTERRDGAESLWSIIMWWEKRRIPYNLFLLAVGVPSLLVFVAAILASHELSPGEDAVEPMALFAAPVLANVAYTLGWLVEGALHKLPLARPLGPRLMRAGLWFSLAVLLFPSALWVLIWLVRAVG